MEEKNTLVAQVVCFQILEFETSAGAVSHNVLYYQQLSIAHYQLVSFYANICFE